MAVTTCESENARGVRCVYASGHTAPHAFRLNLTEAQLVMLDRAAKLAPRPVEFNWAVTSEYSTARALVSRGWARMCYLGMRCFSLTLTKDGLRLVQELPR